MAQVNLESGAYKAYYGEITQKGKTQKGASNLLVYFAGNTMLTNLPKENQSYLIHFNLKTKKELIVKGIKTMTVQGIDAGGFHCILSFGYEETKDIYLIFVQYNNLELYFECKTTKERPWDPEETSPIIALN